jgi:hypothetical protein
MWYVFRKQGGIGGDFRMQCRKKVILRTEAGLGVELVPRLFFRQELRL